MISRCSRSSISRGLPTNWTFIMLVNVETLGNLRQRWRFLLFACCRFPHGKISRNSGVLQHGLLCCISLHIRSEDAPRQFRRDPSAPTWTAGIIYLMAGYGGSTSVGLLTPTPQIDQFGLGMDPCGRPCWRRKPTRREPSRVAACLGRLFWLFHALIRCRYKRASKLIGVGKFPYGWIV